MKNIVLKSMAKLQFLTSIKFHILRNRRNKKYQCFWEFQSLFDLVEVGMRQRRCRISYCKGTIYRKILGRCEDNLLLDELMVNMLNI